MSAGLADVVNPRLVQALLRQEPSAASAETAAGGGLATDAEALSVTALDLAAGSELSDPARRPLEDARWLTSITS